MLRRPNSRCKYAQCREKATHGPSIQPIHCELHADSIDRNLVEQQCTSCGHLYVLDENGKCENCNPESYSKYKRAILAKQNAVMTYLGTVDLQPDYIDKMIDGGRYGKERPDGRYDRPDRVVVLEVDEDQHEERACECEQIRMVNISQSFGGKPVLFVRYNPDKYKGQQVTKTKRLSILVDVLTDALVCELPQALAGVKYLFYDGWDESQSGSWTIITHLENEVINP
jgi:hypothetical protein